MRRPAVDARRPLLIALTVIIAGLFAAPAHADPPDAVDDEYTVNEGGLLAGENVLDNDTDPDGDIVRVNLLTGPSDATTFNLLAGGLFFYVHDGSESPTDTFTYEAEDALGDTDTATVTINVNPVNDAPVLLTPIDDQTATENQPFALDVSGNFFDADGDTLTFSATGLPPSLAISPDGNITGNPDDIDVGIGNVTVTAEDPSQVSVSDTFSLTVLNVNDRPLITGQTPVSTLEDSPVTILLTNLFVTDPDNVYPDDFTLVVRDGANYTRDGNTITPVQDFVDPLTVPLSVIDNSGETNAESGVFQLTVTITPQNDPPFVVTPIGDRSLDEDSPVNIDLSVFFDDVDGDPLDFSATGLPPTLTLGNDGRLTGTPLQDDVGFWNVTVTAEDPSDASASDSFQLEIVNTNDAPVVVTPIGDQQALEDALFSLNVSGNFDDEDGDSLTFTASGLPPTLTITPAGVIIGTPLQDDVGDFDVTVTATDPSNASVDADFELEVVNVNDPPFVVTPIGDRSLNEDVPVNIDLSVFFDDVDGDPLSFTATGLPPTLTLGSDGRLTGTPLQDDVGFWNVTVTAEDPSDASASDSFQLQIVNTNDAPVVVSPIGDQQALEDTPFSLNVSGNFDDEDGDSLTFTASGLPPRLTMSLAGVISGTPIQEDVGVFSVTVTATDPSNASVDAVFDLTVVNVNDPPVITGQVPLVTPEDTPLVIRLTDLVVDDPDNVYPDDFTLTVLGGANYSVVGTTITPAPDFSGALGVRVRVNDGEADSPVFVLDVTVTNVNDQPVIVGQDPDPLVVDEDQQLTITLDNILVQDPDNDFPDDFTLEVLPGDDYSIVAVNTILPAADFFGALSVNVTVSDGNATSPPFSLSVSVTSVNDPPVIVGQNALQTEEETALTITLDDLIVEDPDDPPENLTLEILDGENYERAGNTITPVVDFSGALSVPAQVSDGELTSDVFELTVSVASVEDRPVIEDQLPLSTPEETPLEITLDSLIVSDPDSVFPTDFTLTVFDGPGYTVTDTTITPDVDFNGDLTVQITVNDGTTDSEPFGLLVTVTPVNDIPVIVGQQPLTTEEDTPLTVTLEDLIIEDPDNVFPTDFTLLVQDGANYTVVGQTVTPTDNFLGELSVPVTVSDGLDSSAAFALAITVTPVNDAPFLVSEIPDPDQAVENEFFSFDVSGFFSDVDDGDTLTFSASGLPPSGNIAIDPQTGIIAGTPNVNDEGIYEVTVTATDRAGESSNPSGSFELTISALGRANIAVVIDVAPSPALVGEETRWTLTVTNAGPANATSMRLTGTIIGAGLTVSAIGSDDCTISDSPPDSVDYSCEMDEVLVDGGTAITVLAVAGGAPGDIAATAMVEVIEDTPVDPNTGDNASQRSVSVAEELSNGAVQALGSAGVLSLTQGDVDGDGDPDLVLGTAAGSSTEVYFGSGSRVFLEPPIVIPNNAAAEGVALTDVDDDTDLDLILVSAGGQPDQVFINDGTGIFAALGTLPDSDGRAVTVADFNGDGAVDIAVAETSANSVYVNDGSGGFSLLTALGNALSLDVASADLNADGLPDLVFANQGGPSAIYLNDGSGGFGSPIALSIGDATSVAIADLDGDDRPDLAFGRVPAAVGDIPSNPILLNDGTGQFSSNQLLGAAPTLDIVGTDTDGDGWTDLVFVNETGTHQVWRGSSNGFSLYAEQIVLEGSGVATTGDLGNDSGADIALGLTAGGGALLYLNDTLGNLGLGDAVPPVLDIIGSANVSVAAGSTYADAGARATDNIDGDLTQDIVVDSTVNTSVVGSYQVTYNVTDQAGNPAQPATRTVQVTPAAGTGGGGGGAAGLWLFILLIGGWVAGRAAPRQGTL